MTYRETLERLGLPGLPEPLPRPVIDAHTHLDTTKQISGLRVTDSLAAAAAVNVDWIVHVGCDVESSEWAVGVASTHPQIVATVAIHPNDAGRMTDEALELALIRIAALAGAGAHVRGVGETGLDYFRTKDDDAIARQRRSFAGHIQIAKGCNRTLVIHDRDAHADILKVLDAEGLPDRVVMHCFSGDADFARDCLDRGAWISFPGVVTFPSAGELREALRVVPRDRLLVETDAPYLTPMPHRGKRNAPYLIPHTVRFIAEALDVDLAELCDELSANAQAAFGGAWGISEPARG